MLGLGTFTFVIIIYFIRVILSLLMKLIMWMTKEKYYTKYLHNKITGKIFFNAALEFTIEGFIDFTIFGYLNLKTAEYILNGELIGLGLGIFSITMSLIIFPFIIICLLLT